MAIRFEDIVAFNVHGMSYDFNLHQRPIYYVRKTENCTLSDVFYKDYEYSVLECTVDRFCFQSHSQYDSVTELHVEKIVSGHYRVADTCVSKIKVPTAHFLFNSYIDQTKAKMAALTLTGKALETAKKDLQKSLQSLHKHEVELTAKLMKEGAE